MIFLIALLCCSVAIAEEPRVLFNHGAELAAAGQFDEATEVLRQVAVVRDGTIAAKALSLLGQIAASSAREHIADNPMETSSEDRQAIFEHLQSAERAFAESLSLRPNDGVRQYLETLRAWRHNMTNVWEEYDREQRRNTELQKRIRWLADWEEELPARLRTLLEEPNSPRKFQTGFEAGREQRLLAEELARLSDIPIADAPIADEELAEQWARLPEIQKLAEEAADLLTNHRVEEALPKQEQVLEYLRSLLPQEESPQDQQNNEDQNQEQDEQDQQSQQDQNGQEEQEQAQQEQDGDSGNNEQQESRSNEQQPSAGEQREQHAESPEERAERMLMQVRRKEQAAREVRDQIRALLRQSEPVERDW